jgi:hypothetical protein
MKGLIVQNRKVTLALTCLLVITVLLSALTQVGAYVIPATQNNAVVTTGTDMLVYQSQQRTTFEASGRHWVFYSTATALFYTSSINTSSTSWVLPTTLHTWAAAPNASGDYNFYFDGAQLFFVYEDAKTIYFRSGVFNSDATITWTAVQTVSDESSYTTVSGVSVSGSKEGLIWVGYWVYDLVNLYSNVLTVGEFDGSTYTSIERDVLSIGATLVPEVICLRMGESNMMVLFNKDSELFYSGFYAVTVANVDLAGTSSALVVNTLGGSLAFPYYPTFSFSATYSLSFDKVVVAYNSGPLYFAAVFTVANTTWSAFPGRGPWATNSIGVCYWAAYAGLPYHTPISTSIDTTTGDVFVWYTLIDNGYGGPDYYLRYSLLSLSYAYQMQLQSTLMETGGLSVSSMIESDGVINIVCLNGYRNLWFFTLTNAGVQTQLPIYSASPTPTPTSTTTASPTASPTVAPSGVVVIVNNAGQTYYFRSDTYTTFTHPNDISAYGFDDDYTNTALTLTDVIPGGA